ncbi:MAG: GIY-YIG nuclease family protein [Waterburya sp.]
MWSVYMIRCGDNSLYTGISNDVPKRFEVHQSGSTKAAKYTRNRHPLQLVFSAEIGDKSAASRAEYRLKKLSKRSKELLVTGKTSLFNLGIIETSLAHLT